MLKSYVKILPFVGKYADCVVGHDVEITEKLDGSQFCFGKDEEGTLHFRSKGAIIDGASPPDMFRSAVLHVHSVAHRMGNNCAYYAEVLNKPRHNSLTYERIPKNGIALYGVTDFHRTIADTDYTSLAKEAEELEVDVVPLLFQGKLESMDHAKKFMAGISVLGKATKEGIVIKNYNYPMELNGQVYPFTAVKWVSEEFKEVHRANPDWTSGKDKRKELIESYRTEARWLKAIYYLRDTEQLVGEPKDIGAIIKRIIEDTVEEEKENFKEALYQIEQKDWKANMTRGFAPWYKEFLLKGESNGGEGEEIHMEETDMG